MVKKNLRCCNKKRTSYSEGSKSINEQQQQEPLSWIISTKTDSKYATLYACVHVVFLLTQKPSGLCKNCKYVRTLTLMAEMKKFEIQFQDNKYLLAEPCTVSRVCLKPGISRLKVTKAAKTQMRSRVFVGSLTVHRIWTVCVGRTNTNCEYSSASRFLAHSPVRTVQHEIRLGAVTNHSYTEGTTSNFRTRTGCPHTMFRKASRHVLQENRPWPFPSFYIFHQSLKTRKIRRCVHPTGTAPTYRISHNVPLF